MIERLIPIISITCSRTRTHEAQPRGDTSLDVRSLGGLPAHRRGKPDVAGRGGEAAREGEVYSLSKNHQIDEKSHENNSDHYWAGFGDDTDCRTRRRGTGLVP